MLSRICTLLICLILGCVCPVALAGPLEGELFGYRLGATYVVGAKTNGYFQAFLGQMVIVAEKPEMPTDFAVLELITTPKTFTVANIYARAEFPDEAGAKALEARYADLLSTMYGSKCAPLKAYLDEALKLLCSKQFELTVNRFKPDKPGEKHLVHVALKFDNASAAGKRIMKQFTSEVEQLERESKKKRLEQAEREQRLKGLQ